MKLHEFGEKLIAARKALNMTQTEVADKLFVSCQAVSNWERGLSLPDLEKLPQLCKILKLNVNDLLIDSDNEDVKRQNIALEAKLDFDEIINLAPFLETEDVVRLAANSRTKHELSSEQLYQLGPFMSGDAFDHLVNEYLDDGGHVAAYSRLAPFVHRSTLRRVIRLANNDYENYRLDVGMGTEHQYKSFAGKKLFSDTQLSADHTLIRYRKVFLTDKGEWLYYEKQIENYNLWDESPDNAHVPGSDSNLVRKNFKSLSSIEELIPYIGKNNTENLKAEKSKDEV
ncbi:EXLDI protein [Lactobacillus sp. ESL0791]|uniref:EXLDI protein n=1 Tax=Lactobacillus sp. ESL0791 TaxID=2983234 RepID=UPI0023F7F57D|nr:EXLDI protein [Lactobacillus sp. ESL0791]MDF7637864.1 EXLDI protein [Lactobacillus sp. ESL0791]